MAYPTLAELRTWANINDQGDDSTLASCLDGAVREVESLCGYQFTPDLVATARVFYLDDHSGNALRLPAGNSISSTDDLEVDIDTGGDGTYATAWTVSTDYVLEPLNGVGYDGRSGWPYTAIRPVGTRYWPWNRAGLGRPWVRVTAKWGWASTPSPVFDAVLLLAAESWKLKEAPLGVAGFGDFGVVRVRDNPIVARKLAPYVHGDIGVPIA